MKKETWYIAHTAGPPRHLPVPIWDFCKTTAVQRHKTSTQTAPSSKRSHRPLRKAGHVSFSYTGRAPVKTEKGKDPFHLRSSSGASTTAGGDQTHALTASFELSWNIKKYFQQVLLWGPNLQVCKGLGTSKIVSGFPITQPGEGTNVARVMQGTQTTFLPSSKSVPPIDKPTPISY